MHFASNEVVERHRPLVDAVHAEGAKIQPQIVHAGPDALSPQMENLPSLGPSVIPSYLTGTPSRALETSELPTLRGNPTLRGASIGRFDGAGFVAPSGTLRGASAARNTGGLGTGSWSSVS